MDIQNISIDSSIEIATTTEFTETSVTVKDNTKILEDSNMETATTSEFGEISEISQT